MTHALDQGGLSLSRAGTARIKQGSAGAALADRVAAYDENWTVTLHAPYLARVGFGSRDLLRLHTLAPGASRTFDGWLQVGSSADLKPVIEAEIKRKHLAAGRVRGVVQGRGGRAVDAPFVVIEKDGRPYGWVLGHNGAYELALAQGDYALYATAKNYSQSKRAFLKVTAGASATRDFGDLENPGRISFMVADARSGKPLDARIVISEGQQRLVEFLGAKAFVTELDHKGRVDVPIGPGNYLFTVSSGGGFLSARREIKLTVKPGTAQMAALTLTSLFDPPGEGWYSADLHHHADQAEAVTPPADLRDRSLRPGLTCCLSATTTRR